MVRQLKNMGLTSKVLDTDSLIRLYYSMYDPDRTGISKLRLSTTEYTSSLVQTKKTI